MVPNIPLCEATLPSDRFMPRSEVISATGLSDTTLWREYRAGRFPKPVPLTKNRVGWLESEVRAWMADRLQHSQTQ
jgi:prophage regulatory protein